ncbi:MAG: methyltransferase domain-containing protein, partial [Pseudomonadota bacterium]|nr:methyltransferase domain-containing protein [Pseudomonadota bacterium]
MSDDRAACLALPRSSSQMPSMTVDPTEVAQFDALSTEWWDPRGAFAPLHRFTPVRMDYFRSRLTRHFGLPRDGARPLAGLRVLDIGCGGGLIAEPLHRLGAAVTAIDAAAGAVDAPPAQAALPDHTIHNPSLNAQPQAA